MLAVMGRKEEAGALRDGMLAGKVSTCYYEPRLFTGY